MCVLFVNIVCSVNSYEKILDTWFCKKFWKQEVTWVATDSTLLATSWPVQEGTVTKESLNASLQVVISFVLEKQQNITHLEYKTGQRVKRSRGAEQFCSVFQDQKDPILRHSMWAKVLGLSLSGTQWVS